MSIHKEDDKWVDKYNKIAIVGAGKAPTQAEVFANAAVLHERERLRKLVEEEMKDLEIGVNGGLTEGVKVMLSSKIRQCQWFLSLLESKQ